MDNPAPLLKGNPKPEAPIKERILGSACFLFSEGGLRGTHLRDVCKHAGANIAAVCYHFHSKEGLYEAVAKEAGCQLAAHAKQTAEQLSPGTPQEKLEHIVESLFQKLGDNDAWIAKLAIRELADGLGDKAGWVGSGMEQYSALLQKVLLELLGPRADPEAVRLHALSVLNQCVFYCLAGRNLLRAFPQIQEPLPSQETLVRHVASLAFKAVRYESRTRDDESGR
jgi:TetR/AcrR family transcriptional regulator, regulator of cefoperazone and chloramphenicol sensitivity